MPPMHRPLSQDEAWAAAAGRPLSPANRGRVGRNGHSCATGHRQRMSMAHLTLRGVGMSASRTEIIERLANVICGLKAGHSRRVAVDGSAASGKSTLARGLTDAVAATRLTGRTSSRASSPERPGSRLDTDPTYIAGSGSSLWCERDPWRRRLRDFDGRDAPPLNARQGRRTPVRPPPT